MKNRYTLKPLIENIDQEIEKENSPQRIKLESIIDNLVSKVGSLNSAYQLIDELRNTIRLRDEIDDSMSNILQIKFGTVLLSLYVLLSETNFTMDQSQVDILMNVFSKSLTDEQLEDFEESVDKLIK